MTRGKLEVQAIADQAIKNLNLPRNTRKGKWGSTSRVKLFSLFLVECGELLTALLRLYRLEKRHEQHLQRESEMFPETFVYIRDLRLSQIQKARQHAKHEAGDCVAYLAMLIDRSTQPDR